jgi:hypothetical protein
LIDGASLANQAPYISLKKRLLTQETKVCNG